MEMNYLVCELTFNNLHTSEVIAILAPGENKDVSFVYVFAAKRVCRELAFGWLLNEVPRRKATEVLCQKPAKRVGPVRIDLQAFHVRA